MSTASLRSAILVHELITGGGAAEPGPPALAAEARAILRALLADFRLWGRFLVATTRDARLPDVELAADLVVDIGAGEYPARLIEVARTCRGVLLVAPESGGTHARVGAALAGAGARLLGSTPAAIAAASDKWECHRRFVATGLTAPPTECVRPDEVAAAARRLGYPVVVKPPMGTGSEGVAFVARAGLLAEVLGGPALRGERRVLVQTYVPGTPASVSLLVAGRRTAALGLNHQRVRRGAPFEYLGGVACAPDARTAEAITAARRAVSTVPGLAGYVGVDMVLTDAGCSVLEINPRVTTSYLGLRRALPVNLAELIWRACREDRLPRSLSASGAEAFDKDGADGD